MDLSNHFATIGAYADCKASDLYGVFLSHSFYSRLMHFEEKQEVKKFNLMSYWFGMRKKEKAVLCLFVVFLCLPDKLLRTSSCITHMTFAHISSVFLHFIERVI